MLVLVTGGTGYIGGWCVAELVKRGYDVRTTVRDHNRTVPGAETAVADLTTDDGWPEAMKDVDYVLHVASPLGLNNTEDLVSTAVDGTRRVLNAAIDAGVRRVVLTSAANAASPSDYASEGVTDETLWTDPDDPTLIPYRRSKTLAERTAWEVIAGSETELTTVLPGAVFGPILTADTTGSVGIIQRMLADKMPGMPRIGLEIVDVRDLVDLHLRAMTSPAAAGERFLGTGEFTWMRDMARTLHDGLPGRRISTRQLPDFAVRLAARFSDPSLREITPALGRRNRHTTEKANRMLGWQPRPAKETVLDCANSLIEHGLA
jgi:nucleoside-diphosphate-sugar epimerase